jgi:hypothetical protein
MKEGATLPCTDFPDGKALLKKISPAHSDPISGIIEDVAYLPRSLAGIRIPKRHDL